MYTRFDVPYESYTKKVFHTKKGKRKILKHGAYLPIVCPYAIK